MMLQGPFKVYRGAPFDPGDGRDIIQTIMACYRFEGTSDPLGCGLGTVVAHPSSTTSSTGQIRSLAPEENTPADSFFDIFTELDTTAFGRVHTSDPTHMQTTINSVPPGSGETYFGPGTTVPLYNSANTQIGVLEIIKHEIHSPIICPCLCEPRICFRPNKTDLSLVAADNSDCRIGIPLGGS